MTATIDRFWISRGIEATELTAVKGRAAFYAAFAAMGVTGLGLVAGIIGNLVG